MELKRSSRLDFFCTYKTFHVNHHPKCASTRDMPSILLYQSGTWEYGEVFICTIEYLSLLRRLVDVATAQLNTLPFYQWMGQWRSFCMSRSLHYFEIVILMLKEQLDSQYVMLLIIIRKPLKEELDVYLILCDATWKNVDACLPVEDVEKQFVECVLDCVSTCQKGKSLSQLWL